jgi:hypothetical protein
VHQYKLTEGIDSADFRIVAFYEPFSNERAYIQQVGRVLRNPTLIPGEKAWVVRSDRDNLEDSWAAYRSYDVALSERGFPPSPRQFALAQPAAQYFARRFRGTFDLDNPALYKQLRYPLSVRVHLVSSAFDIDKFSSSVATNLEEQDFELGRVQEPAEDTRVHPYIAIRNSPYLVRAAFPEFEVGFTVYRRVGRYLFFLDTQGIIPGGLIQLPIVDPSQLRRLYTGGGARLTSMTTVNTTLSSTAVRRRNITAHSIGSLGPDLSDHAQLASTSTGVTSRLRTPKSGLTDSVGSTVYVGFTRGRVRDNGMLEFEDYMDWLSELALRLGNEEVKPLEVFNRYAEVVTRPLDTSPRNVLLDIPPQTFVRQSGKGLEGLDIPDLCMDVSADGKFTCTANGDDYVMTITWDDSRARYELTCRDLDDQFSMTESLGRRNARSLISYLNDEQAFRVVPADTKNYTVYTGRLFCKPRLPLRGAKGGASVDLLGLFRGLEALDHVDSEKGGEGSATGSRWDPNSLFNLIDELGRGTDLEPELAGVDLLVCDDMNTETADFLALDRLGQRVIVMHLKAFTSSKMISASSLHEVSSQALKNLGYLQPYAVGDPDNVGRWRGAWNGGRIGRVDRRIRRGSATTGKQAWTEFREALRDPNTSREVWLILGKGPSRGTLVTACAKANPQAELIQMLYSLQSTWTSVSSLGARLRVLSRP